jgi:hypothetical protein
MRPIPLAEGVLSSAVHRGSAPRRRPAAKLTSTENLDLGVHATSLDSCAVEVDAAPADLGSPLASRMNVARGYFKFGR